MKISNELVRNHYLLWQLVDSNSIFNVSKLRRFTQRRRRHRHYKLQLWRVHSSNMSQFGLQRISNLFLNDFKEEIIQFHHLWIHNKDIRWLHLIIITISTHHHRQIITATRVFATPMLIILVEVSNNISITNSSNLWYEIVINSIRWKVEVFNLIQFRLNYRSLKHHHLG